MSNFYNRFNVSDESALINFVDFETFAQAHKLLCWFNEIVLKNGKISLMDICNKMGIGVPKKCEDTYRNYGYSDLMQWNMIQTITHSDEGTKYRACFPMHVKVIKIENA